MPPLHAGQRRVANSPARFRVIVAGRQWGKSRLGAAMCIYEAMQGHKAWWVSPSYPMSQIGWREVATLARQIPGVVVNKSERIFTFPSGGFVQIKSGDNPDSLRGEGLHFVVLDECAYLSEETWIEALRPTLTIRRGRALFISTPKGLNWFYRLTANGKDRPDWEVFHFTTYDNPFAREEEILEAKATLPERTFEQEYLAKFVEDGSFFQNVDKAAVITEHDKPDQHNRHHLVMGVDWALSQDFTVLTVACRDCNRVVDWERFNQIDYTYQRARVIDMAKRWKIAGALPERNSIGQPNIELLIQAGVNVFLGPDDTPGFNTSATTKPALIQALASGLEHGGFCVPADYADELRSYEVETMASGHPKFSAPDGLHDDRVISLALAWWAMIRLAGPIPETQPTQRSKWADSDTSLDGRWRKY